MGKKRNKGINKTSKWLYLGGAVVGLLLLVGFSYATGTAYLEANQSNVEWAQDKGYLKEGVIPEDTIDQADFLKSVVTIYDAEEPGIFVPPGAENHWAAEYYAIAKNEGIIDCGCQIKPNLTLTIEEASKFVVNAINLKSQIAVMKITDVYKWLPDPKETESPLTNEQAAILVKKMSEVFEEKGLSKK